MSVNRHPPLWTWPVAILLASALVLASWLGRSSLEPRYDAAYYGLDRLKTDRAGVPTIVVIGTSKTRCGIEFDDHLSRRLAVLGTPARVVRITHSLATLEDFTNVFKAIEQRRPAAVVVESELVTLEPRAFRTGNMPQSQDWRERARHSLAGLLPPSIIARQSPENHGMMWGDCGFTDDPAGVARRQQGLLKVRASSPSDRAPLVSVASVLRARGTRVILLDLPSRNDAIARKPALLVKAQQEAMRQLEATGLFDRIDNPPQLAPGLFHDVGHLDPRGQTITSVWLASRLSSLLAEQKRR